MLIAKYIKPTATGAGTGASITDAAGFTQIPALLAAANPGDTLGLLAGYGNYTSAVLSCAAGGDAGAPVSIVGIDDDGDPARVHPVIVGTRTDPWVEGSSTGSECFRLLTGSDNLTFRNINFRAIGNGCFRIGGPLANLRIEDCNAYNVTRFVENTVSGGPTVAPITGFIERRCRVWGYGRAHTRIRYDFDDVLIEDCLADSMMFDKEVFAVGFDISSGTTFRTVNAVLRRCVAANNIQTLDEGSYWNADGFIVENQHTGLILDQCVAYGNADAGFDIKADVVFTDCRAYDNKKNYRLWGSSSLTRCESLRPYCRGGSGGPGHHIDNPGTGTTSTLDDCILESNEPDDVMFRFVDPGATVTMTRGRIRRGPGTLLNEGGGTVNLIGVDGS